jgi:hypothetical protein
MARCRFVQPEVAVLQLSEGYTIEVKKRLSVGEERAAFQSVIGEINVSDGYRRPNVEMAGFAEMMAYIVNWNLTGPDGKLIPFSLSALKQIDSETFKEIETALEAHIKAQEAVEQIRKNGQGGENGPATTSPSAA